ncbi:MAG TPA: decarboxylating 6-phosphogluconate dehydrogenase [Actinomycetota bacterium]|nr:decarboxylating 6-phosphogluconate dehydrogenase [Actinomycetota bacterium]
MRMGMVGLGRMGGNMTVRLIRFGHQVVAFDPNEEARRNAGGAGAQVARSLDELASKLEPPRAVWIMVPAGPITDRTLEGLAAAMSEGDVIIDGGNSNWKESIRHGEQLKKNGITLLDCGTSGGVWGLANGYCLMVGGERAAFERLEPIFTALAPQDGDAHVGPSGAGHFVKMVHNGIEYGLLAAYGEGFEILEGAEFDLDLPTIAGIWRYGSVVRSWLLELLVDAFRRDPNLADVKGYVEDSGEGRWTVQAAIEENVPAPITALALFNRFASRQEESYAAKVIAALRQEFGGHAIKQDVPESSA